MRARVRGARAAAPAAQAARSCPPTPDDECAPVTDLLGQVGGVDDELRLEEGVLAVLRQEAQVERQVEVCIDNGEPDNKDQTWQLV